MRYETHTRLTPEQVLKQAGEYFGQGGLGLAQARVGPGLGSWEGGGGTVAITASPRSEKNDTTVEIVTTEWDNPVREFMRKIGGHA